MNETAIAALNYRIEALTKQAHDLQKRLTLALAQVETYKARAIAEAERALIAGLQLDELKSRL